MDTINEIIKYEQRQRILEKMNRMTGAVADFSSRLSYDDKAFEIITDLYKMHLGYICDAIIELDEINNTKTTKRKVK